MLIKELSVIGLSTGETKVYSAILDTGISTINIIHQKTGFERRTIYDIINKLIEKGFITYTVEKGRRTYQCAPPNKLKEKIDERKEELNKFEKIIPRINRIYTSSKPKIKSEVYRGKEGIKAIFEDMLSYKDIYFIGGGWYIVKELPFYWPHYNEKRIKLGVKWYNLVRHELRKRKIPEEKLMSVKFLPEEFSGSPSVVFIYGNKVVNVLWSEEFFGFMIESKEIANNYKKYHKYLWDNIAKAP